MTDDRADLMLEILKKREDGQARLDDKIDGLGADLRGARQHMAAFMQTEIHQDSDIASIKARLERIERRLELSE